MSAGVFIDLTCLQTGCFGCCTRTLGCAIRAGTRARRSTYSWERGRECWGFHFSRLKVLSGIFYAKVSIAFCHRRRGSLRFSPVYEEDDDVADGMNPRCMSMTDPQNIVRLPNSTRSFKNKHQDASPCSIRRTFFRPSHAHSPLQFLLLNKCRGATLPVQHWHKTRHEIERKTARRFLLGTVLAAGAKHFRVWAWRLTMDQGY